MEDFDTEYHYDELERDHDERYEYESFNDEDYDYREHY